MSKHDDHFYWLTEVHPWFDDELADVLVKRLTDRELKELRRQLAESRTITIQRYKESRP